MQARQDRLDEMVRTQQQTAIILERLSARVEAVEKWQQGEERARERAEERRDERIEKEPDQQRANMALVIAGATLLFYLGTFLMAHWRP